MPALKRWPRGWDTLHHVESSQSWEQIANKHGRGMEREGGVARRDGEKHVLITLMSIVNILNQFVWWICLMNVSMTWSLFDIFCFVFFYLDRSMFVLSSSYFSCLSASLLFCPVLCSFNPFGFVLFQLIPIQLLNTTYEYCVFRFAVSSCAIAMQADQRH